MNRIKIIENLIEELRASYNSVIDNKKYSTLAKIPYKIHSYVELLNLRMTDYAESCLLLFTSNHIVPAISLIRAMFENDSILYRVSILVEETTELGKLPKDLDDTITNIIYGTRYNEDCKSVNILTYLKKLDKEYPKILNFYEDLCEFVHPNWDGVQGSYAEIDEVNHLTHIKKNIVKESEVYKWLEACFHLCLSIHIRFVDDIKLKLESFAKICEEEIINRN